MDIFFVLSGFLITDILSRELERDKQINYFHFLRSRFLRIWPALIPTTITLLLFDEPLLGSILMLLFIGNFFNVYSHLWSICVEFQFYLISPWLVKKMRHSDRPWVIVLVLFLISIAGGIAQFLYLDPQYLHSNGLEVFLIDDPTLFWFYCQMPLRMSPYLFGMYAAECYHRDKTYDSVVLEWLSFIAGGTMAWLGCMPMFVNESWGYPVNLACAVLCRPVFGLSLAFVTYIMLSKEELGWHRPSRWLRAFLEWDIWTPIANLSYSVYLIHMLVMWISEPSINLFKS